MKEEEVPQAKARRPRRRGVVYVHLHMALLETTLHAIEFSSIEVIPLILDN